MCPYPIGASLPQVVGLFGNGRIEAFLEATTLTPDQMADPRFVPHIARRLRAFHDLPISHAPASGNMDINTTSSTTAATGGPHPDADPASAEAGQGPAVPAAAAGGAAGAAAAAAGGTGWESQWDAIMGWLDMAQGLSFPHDAAKQAQYDKVDFGAMRRELVELRALCERVGSPLVFCHNDLLSGNILIVQQQGRGPRGQEQQGQQAQEQQGQQDREQGQGGGKDGVGQEGQEAEGREVKRRRGNGEGDGGGAEEGDGAAEAAEQAERELGGRLQFIDFEYSCRGYRGFDLGNHFNEYAGFDCVYDRWAGRGGGRGHRHGGRGGDGGAAGCEYAGFDCVYDRWKRVKREVGQVDGGGWGRVEKGGRGRGPGMRGPRLPVSKL